jgi:hypothetical protein
MTSSSGRMIDIEYEEWLSDPDGHKERQAAWAELTEADDEEAYNEWAALTEGMNEGAWE